MAASHICMSCGKDLARIRAGVEPRYGLPVVACPECGVVAVRTPEPVTARWRSFVRALGAVRAIVLRMAAGAALLWASLGLVYLVEAGAADAGVWALALPWMLLDPPGTHRGLPYDAGWFALIVAGLWLVTQTGVGILLGSGLKHWERRWALWALWGALVVFCLSLEPLVMWFWANMGWLSAFEDAARPGLSEWSARVIYGVGTLAMAPIGMPLGRGLEVLNGYLRNLKFRARRRKARKEQGWTS